MRPDFPLTPPATMRAAQVTSPGCIRIRHVALPEPAADEVRVRIESCGVCASNLAMWKGQPWFRYPLEPGAPGHEACGYIDTWGAEVSGLTRGTRVAFLSYHAFAEYDVTSAAALAVLPAELDGQPFPGEPLGCAMNIFRRAGISAGSTVAIVGLGFQGALLSQLALKAGARVIAIGRRPYSLELARGLGVKVLIRMDSPEQVLQSVLDHTSQRLCDVVIEATGQQVPLDIAATLTRERGRLIIAGYHQDGPRQVNIQLWNWRGLDVINAHERDPQIYLEGIREAIVAVREGRITPAAYYTHHFPLEQLDRAFEVTRLRPDGFFKALVTP